MTTNKERWTDDADSNGADGGDKTGMLHNNFVLSILKDAEIAADFLSHYVSEEAAAQVDWSRLTAEPTVFADRNRLHIADMIFSAPFKNGHERATFIVLLEHKSDVEKKLPLQLLKYVVLQANYFADNRLMEVDGRWPCPVAFVLYNGAKPWRNPPTPKDALYSTSNCGDFIPNFRYLILDLAATDAKDLRGGPLARIFLELLKRAKAKTLKEGLGDVFRPTSEPGFAWTPNADSALKTFFAYISDAAKNAGEKITYSELTEKIYDAQNERLNETMKSFVDEIREQGIERGRLEGRSEGRSEGISETVLRILRWRFGAASQSLVERIESIGDYPTLEKISDAALATQNLADFERFVETVSKK